MYFDDLPKGYVFETESRTLSEDDIIGFARRWDPQAFHTDPEAAKASPYGGLSASGFHSARHGMYIGFSFSIQYRWPYEIHTYALNILLM